MSIQYLIGDAVYPTQKGNKIIIHVCNCNNGWGRGFVISLSKRWKEPEIQFRTLFNNKPEKNGQTFLDLLKW